MVNALLEGVPPRKKAYGFQDMYPEEVEHIKEERHPTIDSYYFCKLSSCIA